MDLELTTVTRDDGVLILAVEGELDVYTALRLRERFIELDLAGQWRIVVDLAGCTFIDNTGLGTIVGGLKRCREHGGSLAIAAAPESVAKIFRITGLTKVFGMHATVDEAAASLLAVTL